MIPQAAFGIFRSQQRCHCIVVQFTNDLGGGIRLRTYAHISASAENNRIEFTVLRQLFQALCE